MGGIIITPGVALMLADLASVEIVNVITKNDNTNNLNAPGQPTIYRPPQWSATPSKYSIVTQAPVGNTDSGSNNTVTSVDNEGNLKVGVPLTNMYVFDAMMKANHSRGLELTKYPVQTGYNNAYNAVLKPFFITLEVGMSDAMDAYKANMWQGNLSKSISAYQTMLDLQQRRVFLTLNTRLNTYPNMMLVNIDAPDDRHTFAGAKMLLRFEQVFFSTVAQQTISARPQVTNSTTLAQVQGQTVPESVVSNNKLPSRFNNLIDMDNLQEQYGTTEAPGSWSSNPTASIPSTLGLPKETGGS